MEFSVIKNDEIGPSGFFYLNGKIKASKLDLHNQKIDAIDMQLENLVAAARSIKNQQDSIEYAEHNDKTGALKKEGDAKRKELRDKRRRYGRDIKKEIQMIHDILFWIGSSVHADEAEDNDNDEDSI